MHSKHPGTNLFFFCLYTQNYLDNFWPDLKATHKLLDSILQSRRERENESHENSGKEYPEHLPTEALEAGIKSGLYIQVTFTMHAQKTEIAERKLSISGSRPEEA